MTHPSLVRRILVRGLAVGACSAAVLAQPSYPHLRKHANGTQLEPEEGQYDFTLVDGLVGEARKHDLRLVLLWFGAWKNSMSSYVPAWVNTDQRRFPRSVDASRRSVEILSPFSAANRDADAPAFAALMRRLRAIDGDAHTVLMVQTENEIGMIPTARDHSEEATRLFRSTVPSELMEYLTRHAEALAPELRATWQAAGVTRAGTWTEVFGADAASEEIFIRLGGATDRTFVPQASRSSSPQNRGGSRAAPIPAQASGLRS